MMVASWNKRFIWTCMNWPEVWVVGLQKETAFIYYDEVICDHHEPEV